MIYITGLGRGCPSVQLPHRLIEESPVCHIEPPSPSPVLHSSKLEGKGGSEAAIQNCRQPQTSYATGGPITSATSLMSSIFNVQCLWFCLLGPGRCLRLQSSRYDDSSGLNKTEEKPWQGCLVDSRSAARLVALDRSPSPGWVQCEAISSASRSGNVR